MEPSITAAIRESNIETVSPTFPILPVGILSMIPEELHPLVPEGEADRLEAMGVDLKR